MFMGVSAVEYSDYQSRGIIQGGVMHVSPLNTIQCSAGVAKHTNDVMSSLIPAQRVTVGVSSFLPLSGDNTDSRMLLSGLTLHREQGTITAR